MAGEMNVQLQANLVADPEEVQLGGKTVTKLRLAHNTRTKRGDEWQNDETWWIDATVWPRFDGDEWPANVLASLSKGDAVDLTGRLKREPWEGRDGKSGISYRLSVVTVGPSLQRASVQVSRNERGGGQSSSGWGGSAPQSQQGWGQSAAPVQDGQGAWGRGFDGEEAF